jgi:hypothetical protein
MADIFSGAGLTIYAAVVLLVAGLVVAFFGKTLFKVVIFIMGAVAGGALAGLLANYIAPDNTLCILGGVVIAGIIGGFLALTIVKGILAIAVGGIFAWIAAAVSPNLLVVLVAFLIGFVLALVFMDRLLGVITGISGGAMAGFAVTGFLEGAAGQFGGLAVGAIVALAGIYYQNWKHKGDLSRPDKDKSDS